MTNDSLIGRAENWKKWAECGDYPNLKKFMEDVIAAMGDVAQRIEHEVPNLKAEGSSPSIPTSRAKHVSQLSPEDLAAIAAAEVPANNEICTGGCPKCMPTEPARCEIPGNEPDINTCPGCGGPADNGFDRCLPPNPYYCTKCHAEDELRIILYPDGIKHPQQCEWRSMLDEVRRLKAIKPVSSNEEAKRVQSILYRYFQPYISSRHIDACAEEITGGELYVD